jgi:DNA-binding NarL/FixJ family response regulator
MRLFIADADKELRVGLQILLHQEPGMQVIGVAVNAKGLLAQVEASQPDVLLLDWRLPGMPMTELIADLQALDLPPKLVVLSVRPEDKNAAKAVDADAFIGKTGPPDELLVYLRSMNSKKHTIG